MKRGMRLAWGLLASAAVAAMTACGSGSAGEADRTEAGTTGRMEAEETETAASAGETLEEEEGRSPSGSGNETEDRTLTVAVFEDIGALNPYTGESPAYALDWVYEGLTAMEDGVPVPELARTWEISEDGLTYTFHLRPDVKFSDGSPFTAENAKRNMDLVLGHKEYYPYLPSLAAVASVEAADEATLTVHLTAPAPSLLNDLAGSYPFGMMGDEGFAAGDDVYQSAGAAAEPGEEHGFSTLGTGMWKLKTYVEGEYSVFERNEDYWGEKPGFRYLKTVVFSSAEEAAEAMRAGEADVMVDSERITPELFKELQDAGFQTAQAPSSSVSVLNLNTAGPVTGDRAVRLALEYAADREEISETVYQGLQEPADSYFSWRVPGTDVGIAPYPRDLEEAGRLLEEAGWVYGEGESVRSKNGQKLELSLVYDASIAGNSQVGEHLKAQYEAVGIQLDLVPQETPDWNESWRTGQFDLLLSRSWGIPYEPYGSFFCMASPGDKFYLVQSGMSGKQELDVIMKDTLGQNDGERMKEDMAYIMESLHHEAVYVPLTAVADLAVYREGLSGPDMNSARGGLGIGSMRPLEP